MANDPEVDEEATTQGQLGGKAMVLIVAFHAAAAAIATYPAVLVFRSALPANPDAWQHLWSMRWYKTCLLEGRPVFLCPELQYPVGAPWATSPPCTSSRCSICPSRSSSRTMPSATTSCG